MEAAVLHSFEIRRVEMSSEEIEAINSGGAATLDGFTDWSNIKL